MKSRTDQHCVLDKMNPKRQGTYKGVSAHLPIQLLNTFAAKANSFTGRSTGLSLDELLDAAYAKTHLDDPVDPGTLEAFGALVDSVNREGDLTFFGRLTLRQFIIGKLCNRLRIVETLKRFGDIKNQKINRPIFITGWYRCGTTYLHNLLATHPQSRAPLYWELMHPCPAVDPRMIKPQKLIRRTKLANRIHGYLAPNFKRAHAMPAEQPEECLHLFENTGMGTTGFFITEAKSFAGWLLEQDLRPAYQFHLHQLKLLNWLRPGNRWVLKWPYHLWHLDTLLEVFPDAFVIHIHRDPLKAIPSVCSLATLAREPFCNQIDRGALGQFWMKYYEKGLTRALAARERAGTARILDVNYADLITSPSAMVQRIVDRTGLEPDEAWLSSIPAARTIKQEAPAGSHSYTLSQFGLDPEQIRERFAAYIDSFGWG